MSLNNILKIDGEVYQFKRFSKNSKSVSCGMVCHLYQDKCRILLFAHHTPYCKYLLNLRLLTDLNNRYFTRLTLYRSLYEKYRQYKNNQ